MSQTNIQVPIKGKARDPRDGENPTRIILYEEARKRSPGPATLGTDTRPVAMVEHHTSLGAAAGAGTEAPDLLFGEHTVGPQMGREVPPGMDTTSAGSFKFEMSGRRHQGHINDLNRGRNVGSTHLDLPPAPHFPAHITEMPKEGGVTLPKDQ